MVGAMDDDMLKELVDLDIPAWRMNTGITKKDLGWGSTNFHLMGRWGWLRHSLKSGWAGRGQ